MNIVFKSYSSLPPLSWAAEITKEIVTIHHGLRLEHGEDWLVDGAWAGPFEAGLPEEDVEGFFAFGLRVRNNEARIDCPMHPLERLFLLREGNRLFVTPSLPFLLCLAKADVDVGYPDYMFDLFRVISRISENCGSTPLAGGKTLQVVANRRVLISPNLDVKIEYRPLEKSFRDFAEYKNFLIQITKGIRDNVSSPARRAGTYGLAAAISNGYDSPMLNVLAAPFGLKEAVTFSAPGDTEDSGEHIGPYIGIKVHPINRHEYQRMPGLPEAEFIATGTRGEDVVLAGAESHFQNKAVITGIFGEIADKNLKNPSADIVRTNTVGCGLLEYRWRVGFLHAPTGHAGCMGMMSLKAICNSREMQPWSVGGKYDRPVARRIIEEAGVPRGSFAKYKIGLITVKFDVRDDELKSVMNPASHASLMDFVQRERSRRPLSMRLRRIGKYAVYRAERFAGRKLEQWGVLDKAQISFDPRHQVLPSHSSYLIPWSVRLLQEKYSRALQ